METATTWTCGQLVLEGVQAGQFFDAGGAPGGPEVEHDDFAAKLGEVDGVLAVVDGEHAGAGWPIWSGWLPRSQPAGEAGAGRVKPPVIRARVICITFL